MTTVSLSSVIYFGIIFAPGFEEIPLQEEINVINKKNLVDQNNNEYINVDENIIKKDSLYSKDNTTTVPTSDISVPSSMDYDPSKSGIQLLTYFENDFISEKLYNYSYHYTTDNSKFKNIDFIGYHTYYKKHKNKRSNFEWSTNIFESIIIFKESKSLQLEFNNYIISTSKNIYSARIRFISESTYNRAEVSFQYYKDNHIDNSSYSMNINSGLIEFLKLSGDDILNIDKNKFETSKDYFEMIVYNGFGKVKISHDTYYKMYYDEYTLF